MVPAHLGTVLAEPLPFPDALHRLPVIVLVIGAAGLAGPGFNLVGDGLREVLDPSLGRGR